MIQRGMLSIRTLFEDYAGLFVMHCHRLNHEDNGLMMLVNVIPAVFILCRCHYRTPGQTDKVRVLDGNGDKPRDRDAFPGYEGRVSVAMGDLDGDGVSDLVTGAGKDFAPEVVAYSGKAAGPRLLDRGRAVQAVGDDARGGISVAAAQIDGTTLDNIIVGSGPGITSEIKVYPTKLPKPGTAPPLFTSFWRRMPATPPASAFATGFVDFGTGRNSIVSAPGPGSVAEMKVFVFPLLKTDRLRRSRTSPRPGNRTRPRP